MQNLKKIKGEAPPTFDFLSTLTRMDFFEKLKNVPKKRKKIGRALTKKAYLITFCCKSSLDLTPKLIFTVIWTILFKFRF